jgi:flagella basal body P-ring formation protein FlgA
MTLRILIAVIAAMLAAQPALAGQGVTLRADTVDSDGVVTLSDLFEGAGPAGRTPLAARTGSSVVLEAAAVQTAARRAGLDWANAEGVRRIVVSGAPAAARGNLDVLTWSRSIAAGEIVGPSDLVWGKAVAAPADAPSDPDAVIGLAARRPLRAGAAALRRDVAAPQVIKAGEMVSVAYEADGVSLALQAKALAGGRVGETISVQNPSSKKTIQAVVAGPGQAIVGPAADELKARSARYALR